METMQVKPDLDPQTEPETAAPAFQPPKKKPKWFKWLKRLLALAVAVALVVFLMQSCSGGGGLPRKTANPTVAASPTARTWGR